jgi:hypothetical protein
VKLLVVIAVGVVVVRRSEAKPSVGDLRRLVHAAALVTRWSPRYTSIGVR